MLQEGSNLKVYEEAPSFFRVIDVLILIFSFLAVIWFYNISLNKDYFLLLLAVLIVFAYLSSATQVYRKLRLGGFQKRVMMLFTIISSSFLVVIAVIFLLKEGVTFSRFVIFAWYLSSLIGLIGWRIVYRSINRRNYKKGINLRKIAIIGMTPSGIELANEIEKHDELGLSCVGFFDDRLDGRLQGDLSQLSGVVDDAILRAKAGEIDSLYICLPLQAEKRILSIIQMLGDTTVNVFMVPDFMLRKMMHGNVSHLGSVDVISVFDSPMYGANEFYKRSFDIVFSLSVLLLLLPIFLIIAIAIKLDSKGRVFFKQDRYGLDGKKIGVHKFRSMNVMENNKVLQATKNDSRITKVGAFLRKTSLDELPQFYDVLLGNMSVVGPRPHAVAHNEEYRKQVDYYMLRHKVRPGITGWAQINGWRGETDTLDKMEKRIEYDLEYIRHWSLWFDIKIIFMTIFKGFIDKNAY